MKVEPQKKIDISVEILTSMNKVDSADLCNITEQAINAGDGMHAMARLAMCKLVDKGISSEITLAALRELDHSGLEAGEGRFIEMESQDSFEMNKADIFYSRFESIWTISVSLGSRR